MNKKTIVVLASVTVLVLGGVYFINQNNVSDEALTNITNNPMTFDNVPPFLLRSFPDTDFSKANPIIENVLTGGPVKDGIPAIDSPTFVPVDSFVYSDDVQAIVIKDGDQIKVYPYNILTWHEIVNDTANGTPIAITFCPLCGSAIVYDRRLGTGESTFGVSGALIESNMVMYDRSTETLWQQSTGEALAGELFGTTLDLYPFQLSTMKEVKATYPNALVLSEETGYVRDYARNPYSGYEENDVFIFAPSSFDERFEAKEIMAVFRVEETVVATPWVSFDEGMIRAGTVNGKEIQLKKDESELTITDSDGNSYPFYFEMWFSFAVQNPEGVVLE